jgi:hypothetical protein
MLLGEIYKTDIIIVFIPPLKNTCEYDLLVWIPNSEYVGGDLGNIV